MDEKPTWEIGDTLCDMHYGLPQYLWNRLKSKIIVDVNGGSTAIEAFLGRMVTNKMLVIIGYSEGDAVAAYSYDDRRFGMMTFDMKRYENDKDTMSNKS